MWKYAPNVMGTSEYLLRTSVLSMMEMNEDIFAAGNCYDARQYKNYNLFCPFAFRLPEGAILVKDLGIEYNYLSNTSDFFFNARKRAENVIKAGKSFKTSKSDSKTTLREGLSKGHSICQWIVPDSLFVFASFEESDKDVVG